MNAYAWNLTACADYRPDVQMTWPMYLKRTVLVNGRHIQLSKTEAEYVSALLMRRGMINTRDNMVEVLWSDAEPDHSYNTLRVMNSRLRVKGVPIRYEGRFGYQL